MWRCRDLTEEPLVRLNKYSLNQPSKSTRMGDSSVYKATLHCVDFLSASGPSIVFATFLKIQQPTELLFFAVKFRICTFGAFCRYFGACDQLDIWLKCISLSLCIRRNFERQIRQTKPSKQIGPFKSRVFQFFYSQKLNGPEFFSIWILNFIIWFTSLNSLSLDF